MKHTCPKCSHEFVPFTCEKFYKTADVKMCEGSSMLQEFDLNKAWLVTVFKREVYLVPVLANSEEEALEKADKAMDKFGEEDFIREFYFDDEWEMEATTFKNVGYECSFEHLII